MWDDWTYAEYMSNCIGGSEIVEKPPTRVIKSLLDRYRAEEKSAREIIQILAQSIDEHNNTHQT